MAKPPVMRPTTADVDAFLDAVPGAARRADAKVLRTMLGEITGEPAVLWGPSIVGFGTLRYRYDSGRAGLLPLAGFSPRTTGLVVNLMNGFEERDQDLLARLGTFRTGVSKLYVTRLSAVDHPTLRELVSRSVLVSRDAALASRLLQGR